MSQLILRLYFQIIRPHHIRRTEHSGEWNLSKQLKANIYLRQERKRTKELTTAMI